MPFTYEQWKVFVWIWDAVQYILSSCAHVSVWASRLFPRIRVSPIVKVAHDDKKNDKSSSETVISQLGTVTVKYLILLSLFSDIKRLNSILERLYWP